MPAKKTVLTELLLLRSQRNTYPAVPQLISIIVSYS
jgi:hypothetical protein